MGRPLVIMPPIFEIPMNDTAPQIVIRAPLIVIPAKAEIHDPGD